ncbi:MAG: beta-lactamase family protein [Actinomycetota bacterium]|nr:beta-lactamase family protein [Actinomycetota bacterium]MDH5223899.1 beta-lactamase family protein [Actinomycetota bacterium]MDH5313689.1 beta-lactamase family protein [Actinomycetota bacterium]
MAAGAVTGIVRDGTLDVSVDGLARADTGRPLEPDSIFYVGSIAKQFVAACIALLEHDGALDVGDPVSRFVPALPDWGERVTISQLVHHTGGVRERAREGPGVPTFGVPSWGNADLLDAVRTVPELDFEPGSRYGYSNRGYLLLAEVAAAVSGTSLAELARMRIFDRLGMTDTFFRDEPLPLPVRTARGHFEADDGTVHVEPARFHAVGAGGLWTTVADLATWNENFDDDRLTDGWLPARLTSRGTLTDGTEIHYAWGLSVRSHRGLPIVSHGGNFPGWESKMVRFPTEGVTVIVLANREDLDVSSMAFRLADDLLADRLDPSAPHADDTFDGSRTAPR